MTELITTKQTSDRLYVLQKALRSGAMQQASRMLNSMHPAEIADLLESLPQTQRVFLWDMIDPDYNGEVLLEVGDEVRESLLENMDQAEVLAAIKNLDTDDMADLILSLPEAVIRETLLSMDKQRLSQVEAILSYPEDTAGGLMDLDTITVRPDVTLDIVLRYLRMLGELPPNTNQLMVVDRHNQFLGSLHINDILINPADKTVTEIMKTDVDVILDESSEHEVAQRFKDHDLISAPVVSKHNILLGRITIDDVVDVIVDEAEKSVLNMAGLNEDEDVFAPVIKSTRRRSIWLGTNLITAFIAAWVIGLFEATIQQVVALAVLMPIVASMGGIAGSQTLTLVIRAQTLGQIGLSNIRFLLRKELAIGLLNGVLWAIVVAFISMLWFQDTKLGSIIGIALIINLTIAALAGVAIPVVLRQLKIDPALAGGVILTTITDVIGFMAFLGIATITLL